MTLVSYSLQQFQSYGEEQRLAVDPRLTFLAGPNDVGKSALLRALRIFREPQEGAHEGFTATYEWRLASADFESQVPQDQALLAWLRLHEEHTLTAEFKSRGPAGQIRTDQMWCRRIYLAELNAEARGDLQSAPNLVWQSGPLQGGGVGSAQLAAVAQQHAAAVVYVGPRRIEQGLRQLQPQSQLLPDASNLTNVLVHLQQNHPTTLFQSLIEFLRSAFPTIDTLSIQTPPDIGAQMQGEPRVYYRNREEPVHLRLCGSGVEQMVALATALLIAPRQQLVLVDEPQAYLHPHAERSLLELFEAHPEHQYVVATHSGLLLNSRPLSQARLLTLSEGETRIADVADRAELLDEIGLTAADLWLADRVLWVEGPSEESVFRLLVDAMLSPAERAALSIRRMPGVSRFSGQSQRRAEATYRFCEEVTATVSPLPIQMRFLFDSDGKSDEQKQRIREASHDRADFLPVRELENLFLADSVVVRAIQGRCEDLERQPVASADIEVSLAGLIAAVDDRDLFPDGPPGDEDPRRVVHGTRVLQRLYWTLTASEYDKTSDAPILASLALEHDSDALAPLRDVLRRLLG
jgi:ABC-type ATPase involved in cell division